MARLTLARRSAGVGFHASKVGMEVVAWSEHLTEDRAAELGARWVDKAELFGAADFVSVHLRLSARTQGLVGAAELAQRQERGGGIGQQREGAGLVGFVLDRDVDLRVVVGNLGQGFEVGLPHRVVITLKCIVDPVLA